MSSFRAVKSGLSREIQMRIDAKFDKVQATQCLEWIQQVINDNLKNGEQPVEMNFEGSADNFHLQLRDGYILGRLANTLVKDSVPPGKLKSRSKMAFSQMDLIEMFLKAALNFGLRESDLFLTVDLFDKQNLPQVVITIQALGRKAQSKNLPGFGPKESEPNIREFSQEQLQEGKNIISLQMGTNKGASQAGMNFGKARSILD